MVRRFAPIVFAAAVVAAAVMAAAGGAMAQRAGNETPEQNVRQSQQYDQLTCANKGFRAKRIAQECGPLQGSDMYDSCVASFDCGGKQPTGSRWRDAPPSQTVR